MQNMTQRSFWYIQILFTVFTLRDGIHTRGITLFARTLGRGSVWTVITSRWAPSLSGNAKTRALPRNGPLTAPYNKSRKLHWTCRAWATGHHEAVQCNRDGVNRVLKLTKVARIDNYLSTRGPVSYKWLDEFSEGGSGFEEKWACSGYWGTYYPYNNLG